MMRRVLQLVSYVCVCVCVCVYVCVHVCVCMCVCICKKSIIFYGNYHLTGGEDYKFVSNSVRITAGSTRVVIPNPVIDDSIVEDDEYFTVTLDSSSLPNGVTVGDIDQATMTILNDDSKLIIMLCENSY